MDKRYFLILIIIFICCINLSIIVINSDVVGSASTNAGKYIFSIPKEFSLYENRGNSALIRNNDNMSIYFESNLSDSDTFNNKINHLENNTDYRLLSKGTLNIDNISVNTVYFQTTNNTNYANFYFEKDNIPFKLVMTDFDYNTDRNLTLEYATFIIQSIHFDYKSE